MLITDQQLMEIKENNDMGLYEEEFSPTPVIDCLLIDIRTLHQQRSELVEGVQAAIRWLEGENGTSLRSKQLRMLLEYVENENTGTE